MLKRFLLSFVFVGLFCTSAFAATQTVPYDVTGLDWSYGDTSATEHWMPLYLPIGGMGIRFKIGIRISGMAIAVKCPLKLEFSYDDAQASGGRNLKIKVKATPQASTDNTFDSNFGINLPNVVQLGLINISPLPDILPWYTLSADLWDLISAVPEVGEHIANAATNVGVAMSSKDALPDLGDSKEYHDTRTLFSLDLTKLLENNAKKSALIGKVWTWLGPKKDVITLAIQVAKACNEEVAESTAKDLIGQGLEVLAGIAQISFKGDPYFKIKSEKIAVVLDWNIGGRTSGSPVVNLIPSNKEGEITINIPPFVQSGEKITLVPSSVSYEFKLDQRLKFQVAVPVVGDIDLGDGTEKTVVYKYLNKNITASDFKLEIPLSATDLPVSEFLVTPGCTSATAIWASPNIDLRGTIDVFQGGTKVMSVSESAFNRTHALIIEGLSANTQYTFNLHCVDRNNIIYLTNDVTKTTRAAGACSAWSQIPSVDNVNITGERATPGFDNISFSWNTERMASTELYFSNSPDYGTNYLSAVKKSDGTFAVGWADYSALQRKLETNHTIAIPNLQTGTKYYCRLVSWTYKNDKVSDGFDFQVAKTIEVTTLSAPSTKVLVRLNNNPVNNMAVAVFKTSSPSNKTLYVTGADGLTPAILLEQGASYQASLTGEPCYNDATSSTLAVAGNSLGALSNINLDITRKPSPGSYVYDNLNNPLSGVTVRMPATDLSVNVTTDNNGHYTIERPNVRGEKDLFVSKTGYITQTIKGTFDNCGLFTAAPVVLSSGAITINVHVTAGGNPLNGAALRAISDAWEIGRATTDAQGNATITNNRSTTATSTPLSIEVTPPQTSKALANTFGGFSYNVGQATSVDVNCDVNTTTPTISNFTLTQAGQNDIWMSFSTDKPVGYSFDVTKPDNQTINYPYLASYAPYQMVTNVAGMTLLGGGTHSPGTYKVRLKVKDAQNNESDTGYVDFVVFSDNSWDFKVKSLMTNSAILSWNKFPRAGEFTKYEIVKDGNMVGTLTDISKSEYTVSGLSANTSYTYSLRCINKSNASIGNGATLTFSTMSLPPVISDMTVTPDKAGLNDTIQVNAQIADPDSNIQDVNLYLFKKGSKKEEAVLTKQQPNANSVQFSHTFTLNKAGDYELILTAKDEGLRSESKKSLTILGSERPRIEFLKIPSDCKMGSDCKFIVRVINRGRITGVLSYDVDWGDGKKETIKSEEEGAGKEGIRVGEKENESEAAPREIALSHPYRDEGSFTVSVTASLATEKNTLRSDPVSANVEVTAIPLNCELTVKSRPGFNSQTFHIKSIPGSYHIKGWDVYFGEMGLMGEAPSETPDLTGGGDVDQDITHVYQYKTGVRIPRTSITRQHQFKFKVRDSKGTECQKVLSVVIAQDVSERGGQGLPTLPGASGALVTKRVETGTGVIKASELGVGEGAAGQGAAGQAAQQAAGQAQQTAEQAAAQVQVGTRQLAKGAPQQQTTASTQAGQQTTTTEEVAPIIDLSIEGIKTPPEIFVGENADITVTVKNNSALKADNCSVEVRCEDGFKEKRIISLNSKGKEILKFAWTPKRDGRQKINASLQFEADANTGNNAASETVEVKKKEEIPQISLRKFTIEGLKADMLEIGKPLVALLELNSSAEFGKSLDVYFTLKGKQSAQEFKQKIMSLKKSTNSFKWELMKEIKPDKYRLNIEVSNSEIKYKEKSMIEFSVLEDGMEK